MKTYTRSGQPQLRAGESDQRDEQRGDPMQSLWLERIDGVDYRLEWGDGDAAFIEPGHHAVTSSHMIGNATLYFTSNSVFRRFDKADNLAVSHDEGE